MFIVPAAVNEAIGQGVRTHAAGLITVGSACDRTGPSTLRALAHAKTGVAT